MVAVPPLVATPVTTPDEDPMVAIDGLKLVQVPLGVPSNKLVVCPGHTTPRPVITEGAGFTVTIADTVPHDVV
jgi:hypothetical protein